MVLNRLFMSRRRWLVLAAFAALALGVVIGAAGKVGTARAAEAQTYVVQVGAQGPWNSDLLMFAPSTLQVHRGDTVTFMIGGFHNIHLGGKPNDLVIAPEVDGKPLPQINPAVAFPRGPKSGEKYTGDDANSGIIQEGPPVYSLIIDAKPGTYPFVCDIHPGMAGNLTVVEDSVKIPGPLEVQARASSEIGATMGALSENNAKVAEKTMQPAQGGKAVVQVGNDTGRAASLLYFPFFTTIKAGESVTFTIPKEAIEPHTVSWPPVVGQELVPVEQKNGPPILTIGPSLAPMTKDGATIKKGEKFSTGLFQPGQSFTFTFADPGTYPYTCNIHPGMNGVVVVEPK